MLSAVPHTSWSEAPGTPTVGQLPSTTTTEDLAHMYMMPNRMLNFTKHNIALYLTAVHSPRIPPALEHSLHNHHHCAQTAADTDTHMELALSPPSPHQDPLTVHWMSSSAAHKLQDETIQMVEQHQRKLHVRRVGRCCVVLQKLHRFIHTYFEYLTGWHSICKYQTQLVTLPAYLNTVWVTVLVIRR